MLVCLLICYIVSSHVICYSTLVTLDAGSDVAFTERGWSSRSDLQSIHEHARFVGRLLRVEVLSFREARR